ncbi:MAG: urate oxidase [Williamsia sp.]|nr:urate oxidase [Williamsia sp.]
MATFLEKNSYGKHAINLSKITRHADYHEFRQITVDTQLEGDFESVYLQGDNRSVLTTDTQKNTVYALAKSHFTASVEEFALYLANYFVSHEAPVQQATVEITEHGWSRMQPKESLHPHAYISKGNEKHRTKVVYKETGTSIWSGISQLLILKTTDSAFEGFLRDRYTTLPEASDRILATECEVSWLWNATGIDFASLYVDIRNTLLETFAHHKSLSVQQTLYAMGEAVLEKFREVEEIELVMPNKHHIPFNLEQFGIQNNNEIFVATDQPYGYITGTVKRSPSL